MSDLSDLIGDYVDRRTLAAVDTSPLDGTAAVIRRKRATRQGATAAASVVGLGALFAGGTVAARYYASIEPASYDLPEGGGTARISADGLDPTVPITGIGCGDSAPEPVLASDGFELELKTDNEQTNAAAGHNVVGGSTVVHNTNTQVFPGFLPQPTVVIVKDGEVVAVQESGGLKNRRYFTPEVTQLAADFMVQGWGTCADGDAALDPGDYEYYVIATVANSPEIAALSRVATTWGGMPEFNGDRWLEPNDWECVNGIYAGLEPQVAYYVGGPPAPCIAAQTGQAMWDPDERALLLPYNDTNVRSVFSTNLVAGPFAYHVDEWAPEDLEEFDPYANQVPLTAATAQCGVDIGWRDSAAGTDLFALDLDRGDLAQSPKVAAIVWPRFGPDGVEARTASVIAPERSRAYLTAQLGYRDEETDEWTFGNVVVGHGWVTVNEGEEFAVSRAQGPAEVDVSVEDISWCGEAEPDELLAIAVDGDLTVSSEAGSVTSSEYTIRGGSSG